MRNVWKNLFCTVTALMLFSSCDNDFESTALNEQLPVAFDGDCDYHSLSNVEGEEWQIVECPEWITPVRMLGTANEDIKLYFESNTGNSQRSGEIKITYNNGVTQTCNVTQSNLQNSYYLQRSRAVGWSYDVRTYSDSRGLRNQIFNTQKVQNFNPNAYICEVNTKTDLSYSYGKSLSDLSKNLGASLNLDGKFGTFSLELQGAFGNSSSNQAKRIFSKIRGYYYYRMIILDIDLLDAVDEDLFTMNFKHERKKLMEIIDSGDTGNIEKALEVFVNNYGTHYVISAGLGGYTDYYYSTIMTTYKSDMEIEGAIKFGYASKFKLEADAKYENSFNEMSTETIEKFVVKGGNTIDLANKVVTGTVNRDAFDKWMADMEETEQFELLSFNINPIWFLFPEGVYSETIENYINMLYYKELPLTRVIKNDSFSY